MVVGCTFGAGLIHDFLVGGSSVYIISTKMYIV